MATAAKFVQPIPICLAYLVPLDVDVVPKFNQWIGRINFAAVAMEIKNQGFKFFLNFFHQTS
jgi:predicted membrane protein